MSNILKRNAEEIINREDSLMVLESKKFYKETK